jgi:hypothetical protein
MKRLLVGAVALALGAIPAVAQSLEDLNIQIHGYATQGFLYTTQNNIFTTNSSNGSPAWTEAVVNVTAQPIPKLRIGVQARYFLLGNFGNAITLDWASADYKVDERFGVRFGKVKTPAGLYNDIQDIDPSYIWSLLPQSVYPISSRNTLLSQNGAVVYGTFKLGTKAGKLEYRGWGGENVIAADDGYFVNQREEGITFTSGLSGVAYGGALHWKTPLPGLMVGVSDRKDNQFSAAIADTNPAFALYGLPTTLPGSEILNPFNVPDFFAQYEKNKLMVACEWVRMPVSGEIALAVPGFPASPFRIDQREWYGMATYKLTDKLTAGVYHTQFFDHQAALGPGRYSKDWTISGRYDFNQYIYAKAEEHFIEGTAIGYDYTANGVTPGAPSPAMYPNTKLTVLKIGVSF